VHPISGKTRSRYECDCTTAQTTGLSGDRCEIDDENPILDCGTALPVLLYDSWIANYSFLENSLYAAFCDDNQDYFPTSWTGSEFTPVCDSGTVKYWAADNVRIASFSVTATSPINVCDDSSFVSAYGSHQTFCTTGPGSSDDGPIPYFWGQYDNLATASVEAVDLVGRTSTCEVSLYAVDDQDPTIAQCNDFDLTDYAGIDSTTGLFTWTGDDDGRPFTFVDSVNEYGPCIIEDNLPDGIQTVKIYSSSTWSECGSVAVITFERNAGAQGAAKFSTQVNCVSLTYNTADTNGNTAHTTGLPMYARPTDMFENNGVQYTEFKVFLYDILNPSVACPIFSTTVSASAAQNEGSTCVFNPSLVGATDADSGIAEVEFTYSSGDPIGIWRVNTFGECDGGDLTLDGSFVSTISSLTGTIFLSVAAVVSDASVINGDARSSSPVTCSSFAVDIAP
jgi:hypothetical protein